MTHLDYSKLNVEKKAYSFRAKFQSRFHRSIEGSVERKLMCGRCFSKVFSPKSPFQNSVQAIAKFFKETSTDKTPSEKKAIRNKMCLEKYFGKISPTHRLVSDTVGY